MKTSAAGTLPSILKQPGLRKGGRKGNWRERSNFQGKGVETRKKTKIALTEEGDKPGNSGAIRGAFCESGRRSAHRMEAVLTTTKKRKYHL